MTAVQKDMLHTRVEATVPVQQRKDYPIVIPRKRGLNIKITHYNFGKNLQRNLLEIRKLSSTKITPTVIVRTLITVNI